MTYIIDAKTPRGQANQMARALKKECAKRGLQFTGSVKSEPFNTDFGYGVTRHTATRWIVEWEDGPYEWGVVGVGLGNIWGEEDGYRLYDSRLTATFEFASHVSATPDYSFDLCFYPNKQRRHSWI